MFSLRVFDPCLARLAGPIGSGVSEGAEYPPAGHIRLMQCGAAKRRKKVVMQKKM